MLPQCSLQVIRSADIGVSGVAEGRTVAFPEHLFEYLKIKPRAVFMRKPSRGGRREFILCGARARV